MLDVRRQMLSNKCNHWKFTLSKSNLILYPSYSLFTIHYSLLKLFTGFATAAFIAWKLIVNTVMMKITDPAAKKIPTPILILYAKLCNHWLATHQATGKAIR